MLFSRLEPPIPPKTAGMRLPWVEWVVGEGTMLGQPGALGKQAPRGWGWLLTDVLSLSHPALMAHVPPLSPPPLCCTLAISQLSLDQVILVCSPPAPLPPISGHSLSRSV